MTEQHGRTAARKVVVCSGLLVIASLAAMCFFALRAFDAAIQPELTRRSQFIAASLGDDFENALNIGIPFEAMGGIDKVLKKRLDAFEEVDQIAVVAMDGRTISEVHRAQAEPTLAERAASVGSPDSKISATPIFFGNSPVGEVRVSTNLMFIRNKMQDVFLDVMVVALVAMLLAFELVQWVVAGSVAKPFDRVHRVLRNQATGLFGQTVPESAAGILRRIARRLTDRANDLAASAGNLVRLQPIQQAYFVDIRLPLFLFSTATEIGGAFLPIYARDAGGPDWLTPDMAASAPLIAYLISMAIIAPIGGRIVEKFGPRLVFLAAVPLTAIASAGVGLGYSALSISAWIGAMAFVYALATTACHTYVLRTTPAGDEAKAISSYLFVIIAGAFCGSSLGGVLADRIGGGPTFFVGALIALVAAALGGATIIGSTTEHKDREKTPAATGGKLDMLFNGRFMALVVGIAIPANLGMSVFIWFLVPVVLEQAGSRSADIGRVIMLYYLVPLIIGPMMARLADGRLGCVPLLIGGMGLSGVALSSLAFWPGYWPMVSAVVAFGFGGAMCKVSMHAHAIRIAAATNNPHSLETGFAVLRLLERVAAIIGLLLSATLAASYGYSAAISAVGAAMIFGALLVGFAETSSSLVRVYKRYVQAAGAGKLR